MDDIVVEWLVVLSDTTCTKVTSAMTSITNDSTLIGVIREVCLEVVGHLSGG